MEKELIKQIRQDLIENRKLTLSDIIRNYNLKGKIGRNKLSYEVDYAYIIHNYPRVKYYSKRNPKKREEEILVLKLIDNILKDREDYSLTLDEIREKYGFQTLTNTKLGVILNQEINKRKKNTKE